MNKPIDLTMPLQFNRLFLALTLILVAACNSGTSTEPNVNREPSCNDRAVFGLPESSPYIFPWPVGESALVAQVYCTNASHSNQLAYDFIRPFGSEVTAVRDGVVYDVLDEFPDYQTNLQNFNFVFIEHDDRTLAFYAHLQQSSVNVAIGDPVVTGQVIALNGNSGTTTPCDSPANYPPSDDCGYLHFGVYQTTPPQEGLDIAVNFRNSEGPHNSANGLIPFIIYIALPY